MDQSREATEVVELLGDWMSGPGPLFRKLAAAVARAVGSGDLALGERLPSERQLAAMLAVSRATVVAAYDELRGLGVVDSRQGSGTRVCRQAAGPDRADGRIPGGQATSIFQRLVNGPGELISLAFAVEPAAAELRTALEELIRDDLTPLLADAGYHPRGVPGLRRAVAEHYTALGLPTTPEQVIVTTGATQAIGLAAGLYVRRGARVVVESPAWPGCLDVFRAAGARLVSVPLDDEGIRVDALARALTDEAPALLYVMPTYHNPTGTLMSAGRRRRVAELAARHGVPVLEDNAYDTYASYGTPGPAPLAAYAPRDGEIISVGSLAKALWAGLRIGWMRAPRPVTDRLARRKALADLGSPVLDQALTARLLARLPELAPCRAETLRERLRHLGERLADQLPGWSWTPPAGGAALWIRLPDTDARVFAQVALRHGVEVVPGATMDPSGAHDDHIRVPFTFPAETLDELVRRLSAAWAELHRHGPATAP